MRLKVDNIGGTLTYDVDEGYQYESEKGILYDLLEGKSLKGETTSDILFIMLADPDAEFDGDKLFVGWQYGATLLDFNNVSMIIGIESRVKEYEKEHPEIVEYYNKDRRMINKIIGTVEAYLITNKEVLSEEQKAELCNEVDFLRELKKGE